MPLSAIEIPTDLAPWRLGVVLQVDRSKATVGLRPQRAADGSLAAEREAVEIPFDEVKWAKVARPRRAQGGDRRAEPRRRGLGGAEEPRPADRGVVADADPRDRRRPDRHGPAHGPRACGGRRLLVLAKPVRPRLQAKRQPGSSYKPFVYATALDNGYKPTSIVLDAPIEIEQGAGKEVWTPKNYDGTKSYGPSTLRVGIEKSRNQMTVRLAQDMGMPMIVEYSKRFGVYDDLLPVLAMSLGSGETTLVKLAAAYSTFANGGKQVRPTLIDRIQDRWGKTIWRYDDRECPGCNAESWKGQAEPTLPRGRPQADHRPAHGLPDHLDDGGRDPARHGNDHQADPSQRADGRQDRHHQRREGRLVRRLHARPRGRRVHRLRHAAARWARARPAAMSPPPSSRTS